MRGGEAPNTLPHLRLRPEPRPTAAARRGGHPCAGEFGLPGLAEGRRWGRADEGYHRGSATCLGLWPHRLVPPSKQDRKSPWAGRCLWLLSEGQGPGPEPWVLTGFPPTLHPPEQAPAAWASPRPGPPGVQSGSV